MRFLLDNDEKRTSRQWHLLSMQTLAIAIAATLILSAIAFTVFVLVLHGIRQPPKELTVPTIMVPASTSPSP
jgi:hypothetical protein